MKSLISKIFLAALLTCGVHVVYASEQAAQQKTLKFHKFVLVTGTDFVIGIFRSPSGKSLFAASNLGEEAVRLASSGAIHYRFDVAKNQVRACSDDPAALAVWKASRDEAKAPAQASSAPK